MYATIPKAQAAGVRFLLGDDYGAIGFPHGTYGAELRLYVEHAGVTPLDVIGWATRNGAALVGREHDLGTIEVGQARRPARARRRPERRHRCARRPTPPRGAQGRRGRRRLVRRRRPATLAAKVAVAHAHAAAEGEGDIETTMATLDDDPRVRAATGGHRLPWAGGGPRLLRALLRHVPADIAGFTLLAEWTTDEGVGQEYELVVDGPDGPVAHHIIGILNFGDDGRLSGERLYASDELFRVMVGPALDHARPLHTPAD